MKNFNRKNQLLSLCGLNCGLCPMNLGGYCPGCGGGEGNQSCRIAKCSLERDSAEYCSDCSAFPCEKYDRFEEYDSFITHRNHRADLARAKEIGIEAYNKEQMEKIEILKTLLSEYNDGRKKNFYCVAVNLLELTDLREALDKIHTEQRTGLNTESDAQERSLKEKSACAVKILKKISERRNIELKLHKKR